MSARGTGGSCSSPTLYGVSPIRRLLHKGIPIGAHYRMWGVEAIFPGPFGFAASNGHTENVNLFGVVCAGWGLLLG